MYKLKFKIKFFLFLFSISLFQINISIAENRIIGVWEKQDGTIYDVLDGFQVSTGPILITSPNGEISSGTWSVDENNIIAFKIDYYQRKLIFIGQKNFRFEDGDEKFSKINESNLSEKISLEENPEEFINNLTKYLWSTNLGFNEADFSTTFSSDSGVVDLTDVEGKVAPSSWSIGSGVFKLSENLIISAFITPKYMVGLNENDDFIVFKTIGEASKKNKTAMKDQRDEFFNSFLTGSWEKGTYYYKTIYRFRPVEGELKGKVFNTNEEGILTSAYSWEYSPSTGVLKLGGYTEYIQALVIGNTLALLDEEGNQTFFSRSKESDNKRYTLADVKITSLNENSLSKIEKELSGQFRENLFTYLFEFSEDSRTGFIHKFNSNTFNITGETFSSTDVGDSNILYSVEDFIVFDSGFVLKRDNKISRLKVKTSEEAKVDSEKESKRIQDLSIKQIIAVITLSDGEKVDVPLGIENFKKIQKLELVIE